MGWEAILGSPHLSQPIRGNMACQQTPLLLFHTQKCLVNNVNTAFMFDMWDPRHISSTVLLSASVWAAAIVLGAGELPALLRWWRDWRANLFSFEVWFL